MTTHQDNFQRMAMTGWVIGRFGIKGWVEAGVLEGETVGYFSQFIPGRIGMGCDIDVTALEVASERYPWLRLTLMSSTEYLSTVQPPRPSIFYFDTTWGTVRPLAEEMKIVRQRFPEGILFVNNVDLPCAGAGCHKVPPIELQRFGRVIVPDHSMPHPVAGYGFVVPDDAELPSFIHWKVLPRVQ